MGRRCNYAKKKEKLPERRSVEGDMVLEVRSCSSGTTQIIRPTLSSIRLRGNVFSGQVLNRIPLVEA